MRLVKYSVVRGMLTAPRRMCLLKKYSVVRGMLTAPIQQILFFYCQRIGMLWAGDPFRSTCGKVFKAERPLHIKHLMKNSGNEWYAVGPLPADVAFSSRLPR